MDSTGVLSEAWQLYRAYWRHFIPIAFVVFLVIAAISLVLTLLFGFVGALVGTLLGIVGTFWLQGALVSARADVRDGRADLSIGETFRHVQPRLGSLVGAGLLAGLGIAVGFILLIVPGLYLLTIWSLVIPVVVLERVPAMDSFGRSRELVRGNGWNVFGVIVMTVLILIAVSIVISLVLTPLQDDLASFVQSLVGNVLTAPFLALAWTVMYYRLAGQPRDAAPAPAV
jgi:hypothetical protein